MPHDGAKVSPGLAAATPAPGSAARRRGEVASVRSVTQRPFAMHHRSAAPTRAHPSLVPFAPAARRELTVFGATGRTGLRAARKAAPGPRHRRTPGLPPSPAPRIVGDEVLARPRACADAQPLPVRGRSNACCGPPNRRREPDARVLDDVRRLGRWRSGGTALVNNIGAAATIARAHAHLVPERLPFLDALPERACPADLLDLPPASQLVAKDVPFCLLGVRGAAVAARPTRCCGSPKRG
jgi:hypothetical protein